MERRNCYMKQLKNSLILMIFQMVIPGATQKKVHFN
jgi:hypothetical protein